MGKKISFDEASKIVKDKFPYLTLIKFNGTRKKALFKDSEYLNEFEAVYRNVISGDANHPERSKMNKINGSKYTFEEAKLKIESKFPHLELLTYNGYNNHCLFHDKDFGEEGNFEKNFGDVLSGKVGHPKRRLINLRKALSLEDTKNKREKTNIKKYGFKNVFQNEDIKNKIKETWIKNYGVDHPNKNKEKYSKLENTNFSKYGFKCIFQIPEIKEKIKETNLNLYGHECAIKNISLQEIRKVTVINKILNAEIKNIKNKQIINDIKSKINENDDYHNLLVRLRQINYINNDGFLNRNRKLTAIENIISNYLKELNIDFKYEKYTHYNGNFYMPDFTIEDHKIIIECDGLYYHSDAQEIHQTNKNYHKQKKEVYTALGYDALFFRCDELYNKFDIVKSIINSKLNLNNKIFARKCNLELLETNESNIFFDKNHLMGKGIGATYCLKHNNEIVCAMRIINKKEYLEISRFCSKLNTTVVGGFSKLLKHVIKQISPKKIISYVDMRYGNGNSLLKNNFKEISNNISFKWTDKYKTFHRMKYKNNTGYDYGLYKIWDCGQKKFELIL